MISFFGFPGVATVSDALRAMNPGLHTPSPPGAPGSLAGIVYQPGEFAGIIFGKKEGESKDRAGFFAGFFFGKPHCNTPIETQIGGYVNTVLYSLPDPDHPADYRRLLRPQIHGHGRLR